MYSTYTVYTRKEYMKFARITTILKLKKIFPLLYLLCSVILFFVFGNISFDGVLRALIHCFLVFLVAGFFVFPIWLAMSLYSWNTDKTVHNLRIDMVFNESDLTVTGKNGQTTVKYDDIHKVIETKTNFYIMLSYVKAFIVTKDNCSEELIDFIRKIKK